MSGKRQQCPVCGSPETAQFVYGLLELDYPLQSWQQPAGCIVYKHNWSCDSCRQKW